MVAPKKSSTALHLIPEETTPRMMPNSSKSTESLYSTSSSKYSASALYRRRTQASNRQNGFIPATTEVRQRVLSARRLRMKTLQNQLSDSQTHIAELAHENRILRTLHKRQDSALSKYESTNAELPQLLHSHAEEIRVWQTKYRTLQSQNKELAQKLKQKESQILSLSDQNKYLCQLNKDKNLEDRQRLTDRVQQLDNRLLEKDNDLKLLARRLQLESKSYKIQLQNEHKKFKDAMAKLEKTRNELAVFTKLEELNLNDKFTKATLEANPTEKSNIDDSLIKNSSNDYTYKFEDTENKSSSRSVKSSISGKQDETDQTFSVMQKKDEMSAAIRKGTINNCNKPHKGQGDGLDDNDDELDELTKDILLANLESSLQPSQKCSYDNPTDNDYEDDYEDLEDDDDNEVIISTDILPNKSKQDFCNIRKKINDDYKQRQSFLETYCRQASSDALKEERKVGNSRGGVGTIDVNRKAKLLAAMKEIDHKSQDDI